MPNPREPSKLVSMLHVGFLFVLDTWALKVGLIRCTETSVNNYHTTLCNIVENVALTDAFVCALQLAFVTSLHVRYQLQSVQLVLLDSAVVYTERMKYTARNSWDFSAISSCHKCLYLCIFRAVDAKVRSTRHRDAGWYSHVTGFPHYVRLTVRDRLASSALYNTLLRTSSFI
jgi:hypothetical protein